jgi:hypothetical protein
MKALAWLAEQQEQQKAQPPAPEQQQESLKQTHRA